METATRLLRGLTRVRSVETLHLFARPAPLRARATEPPFSLAAVEPWETVTCTGTIHSILIDPRFSPTRVDVTVYDDTASLKVRLHVDRPPSGLRVGDELLVDGLVRPDEDGSGLVVIAERWAVAERQD